MHQPSDLLSGLRNGRWLDAQEFPPLRFAVDRVLPEGMTLLVAPPKAGKSWFALSAALAAACGGRVLGAVKVDARPSLYLAMEDGDRRLQDRCRQLLGSDPIPERFDYMTRLTAGATATETLRAWLDLHGHEQPLVVLDTLGKVAPPAMVGESAYSRDYRVAGMFKQVADDYPGTALVVVHHVRKEAGGDFVDSVSGTHGIAGAADTIVSLTRSRMSSEGLLRVTGRDTPEGEYALTFDRGSEWRLDGATFEEAAVRAQTVRATAGLSDRSAEVVEYVVRNGRTTPAQVAEALGLDAKSAAVYLGRAVDAGRIAKAGRGAYTPLLYPLELLSSDPPATTHTTLTARGADGE